MLAGAVIFAIVLLVLAACLIYRQAARRRGWIDVIDSGGGKTRIPLPPHSLWEGRSGRPNQRFTTATMEEMKRYVDRSLLAAGWTLDDVSRESLGICLSFRRGDKRLRILEETNIDLFGGKPLRTKLTITVDANVKASPLEEDVDVIRQLAVATDREAVPRLTALLEDARPVIRREAASALAKIKDERSLRPLLDRLEDDDAAVRQCAAVALGELRRKEAVEGLIAGLHGGDAELQTTCAWSLGKIKDSRAAAPLITALEAPYWKLKMHAAIALGEIGDRSAVEPLIGCLKDDSNDVKVRAMALAALTRLVDAPRISILLQEMSAGLKVGSLRNGVKDAVAEGVAEWAADAIFDLCGIDS